MAVTLNTGYLGGFVASHELDAVAAQVRLAHDTLHGKTGPGSEFLGWLDLPGTYDRAGLLRITECAKRLQAQSQAVVVIGIGGSYLGARAALEFLRTPHYNSLPKNTPDLYFAGNSLSPTALQEILRLCEGKDLSVIVISKSGTTTEPALAFRVFRTLLEQRYGREAARQRIVCVTDAARGSLRQLADTEGWETFVIPDDIGGRYSVLTPVGLLPMAVAGIDIEAVLNGASRAQGELSVVDPAANNCYRYAAIRSLLYRKGFSIEVLVSYEPSFALMAEWYKQLFGESEGKDQKGIFPASMIFSTDLHSLGQFVQDGSRLMFETVVDIQCPKQDLFIPCDPDNFDGLNFLADQNLSEINRRAFRGTSLAHLEGGTPGLVLEVPDSSEAEFGYLVYFFEKACAVSGYMLGVNPFDQPGVEQYKRNMFALLGKPGYEDLRARLESQMS